MELDSLTKIYVAELKDLFSAENQILRALPKMIAAARSPKLKRAFAKHERQTRQHVNRLERIFRGLGYSARGKHCDGMEGLLKEGAELIKARPDPEVLDAGLISAAQHVEHYEMAGYGTVRTWARVLGRPNDARLLQHTLDEEAETDMGLTDLAKTINVTAI
jgi:ferritin-like metal-binding protein YciE